MSAFRDWDRVCRHRCLRGRLDYDDAAQVRRAFTICRADIRSDSGTDDGAHADGNGHTDAGTDRSADCHSATAAHSNGCT